MKTPKKQQAKINHGLALESRPFYHGAKMDTATNKDKRDKGKTWLEVVVSHAPAAAEAVANFLFENGASGLVQDESAGRDAEWETRAGFGKAQRPEDLPARLDAFLGEIETIFGLNSAPKAEWNEVQTGDWAEKWKEDLAPIEIDDSLVIKPSWCEYASRPGQVVIELDPGMAFGTGRHASTSMCLQEIAAFQRRRELAGLRILDVGTGSGILALACAALGGRGIIAVDIDPETLPVAAANLEANGLADRVFLACAEPRSLRGCFDFILANVTAGVLISMAADLAALAAPGATLVLSGVLLEQAADVEGAFTFHGFQADGRRDDGEWTAMTFILPEGQ